MSIKRTGPIKFAKECHSDRSVSNESWKILIVDDDESVHQVTTLALRNFTFSNRKVEFLSAYSASGALLVLEEHKDIALVLLDVVMESEDAGLSVVRHLRDTLGNKAIRIILRTGQPGHAPANQIVCEYDINDYKEKNELTSSKLYCAVYTALRAHRDILALEANRKGLETVIEASASMFSTRNLCEFAQGVLEQLTALLYLDNEAVFGKADGIAAVSDDGNIKIIAATGAFSGQVGNDISNLADQEIADAMRAARKRQLPVIWSGGLYATYFMTENGHENIICVRGPSKNDPYFAPLIDLFLRNVSIAFDNIQLQEDLSKEIVERREAEHSAAILARLPGELPEPVMRISDVGVISYANDFSAPILEHFAAQVGTAVPQEWRERVKNTLDTAQRFDTEIVRNGRTYEVSLAPVPEAGYVNLFGRDVTRFRDLLKKLEHTAFHDHLTGIANRLYFKDHLETATAMARRHGGLVGVMLIDLNRFKQINDAWGHNTGDLVLKVIADRLADTVRESDVVARLGGDEFGVVVSQPDTTESIYLLAERIQNSIAKPVVVDGRSFSIGSSLGISMFPMDSENADDLQQYADLAMYHAKGHGRNRPSFYNSGLQESAREKLDMEADLRNALETDRLEVFYQPLVSLIDSRIIGAEALVRLRQPDGSLVPPGQFIPVAEETGLIKPIGERVLQKACIDIRSWLDQGIDAPRIAFNLSGKQLQSRNLPTFIEDTLNLNDISSDLLEVEITESVLIGEEVSAAKQLGKLREIGLSLAIDDFGTGYSSLSYLRHLPVSKLKIDRSFVVDMLESEDAAAIIDAIISLGNSLRLRILAEGIELPEHMEMLLAKGCAEGQGYLFSPPIPCEAFEKLLLGRA